MRRTARRAPAVVVLAAIATGTALAGCGGQSVTSTDDSPTSRFDKRAEQIARDWPEVRPLSGHREDLLPLQAAAPTRGRGDTSLTVTVGHGACDADYGARAHESERVVVVGGWSVLKKSTRVCTHQLLTDKVKLRLAHPLGDRAVVDAATGKRLTAK